MEVNYFKMACSFLSDDDVDKCSSIVSSYYFEKILQVIKEVVVSCNYLGFFNL